MKTRSNGLHVEPKVPGEPESSGSGELLPPKFQSHLAESADPGADSLIQRLRQTGPWEHVCLVFIFLVVVLYVASIVKMIADGPPYPDLSTPRFPGASRLVGSFYRGFLGGSGVTASAAANTRVASYAFAGLPNRSSATLHSNNCAKTNLTSGALCSR